MLIKIKVDGNMIVTYDVFNENVGTVGRYKSLEEAVKAAKKMNYRFAIFKQVNYEMPELVKWVFPKKR